MSFFSEKWIEDFKSEKTKLFYSFLFLVFSFSIFHFIGRIIDGREGFMINDFLHNVIGPINLTFFYGWGVVIIFSVGGLYTLWKIKYLAEIMGQIGLLILVRNIFLLLVPLQIPQDAIEPYLPLFFHVFNFHNDLFFSGHVGISFLGFLIFKEKIRWFFLFSSLFMAYVVIAMHIHYTIDVIGAYFIGYVCYRSYGKVMKKINKEQSLN